MGLKCRSASASLPAADSDDGKVFTGVSAFL